MLLYAIPLVALLELFVLIQVGGIIGVWATIGLVFLTGITGVTLLRLQGFRLLAQLQERLNRGEMPAAELLEGVALLVGGILLLTPGFVTDAVGFSLLLPFSRQWLLAGARDRIARRVAGMSAEGASSRYSAHSNHSARSASGGRVFEGEYEPQGSASTQTEEPSRRIPDDGPPPRDPS